MIKRTEEAQKPNVWAEFFRSDIVGTKTIMNHKNDTKNGSDSGAGDDNISGIEGEDNKGKTEIFEQEDEREDNESDYYSEDEDNDVCATHLCEQLLTEIGVGLVCDCCDLKCCQDCYPCYNLGTFRKCAKCGDEVCSGCSFYNSFQFCGCYVCNDCC